MANENNLIPLNKRSKSAQREIQEKGRQANKEKIQKKKLFKECLESILELGVTDNMAYNELAKMGIDPKDIDNKTVLAVAMFKQAAKGDVSAFKEIKSVIGEEDCITADSTIRIVDDI